MYAWLRAIVSIGLLVGAGRGLADTSAIDLTVTGLTGAPASVEAGKTFTVSSTVATTGAVTKAFTVGLYLSTDATITTADTLVGSRTVTSLAKNGTSTATTTVTVPANLAPRSYYMGALVDSGKVVAESNENNNARAGSTVQVTAPVTRPDLTLTALTGAPASVGAGGAFTLSSTVTASGAPAGAFTVSFYLSADAAITTSDIPIGSRAVASLASGATSTASTTVTVPASTAAGSYTVGAIVDSAAQVTESNESNNTRTGGSVAVLRPDLSITSLTAPPPALGIGDGFALTETVTASSSGLAAGSFTVGYYLSLTSTVTTSGVFLGSRTVAGLAAGQASTATTTLTIPGGIPVGTWYLGVIADTGGAVAESSEANNVGVAGPFQIGAYSCQHPATPIDDGNPCTLDRCDPMTGVAHAAAAAGATCSDANYCNGFETCDGAGTCLAGLPPGVDDGNACTADSCDPATGVWHVALPAGASCSDANACNGAEVCSAGAVCLAGTPPPTDDANACTADACDPVLGVSHTPIPGCVVLPPDPAAVTPPHDLTVATDFAASTSFLYEGANPIQAGVAPGAIEARRVAVVRGSVRGRDGTPVSGVKVTALSHPELGFTFTRADGVFDLALNGGGLVTLAFQKDGFLPAQRQVDAPWRDFVQAEDLVLVPYDTQVTAVATGSAEVQVARGSPVADADGARTATVMFPAGTQAAMELADGSTAPLSTLHVRATEFTVGSTGQAAMPAALPAASAYTYAVELSVDEAVMAGARGVTFDRPVPVYLENFLGLPTGWPVPSGYYDREQAVWIPSHDGRVIKIMSVSGGAAAVDADGDGNADAAPALAALGFTQQELQKLATTYGAGQTLWRMPVAHFSIWDFNFAWTCIKDDAGKPVCTPPDIDDPELGSPHEDKPTCQSGSIIECQNQVLGETLGITGTPYTLSYRSNRQKGRSADRLITVRLPASPNGYSSNTVVEVYVGGQAMTQTLSPAQTGTITFQWDGLDAYGREVQGATPVLVRVGHVYPVHAVLVLTVGGGGGFGTPGGATVAPGIPGDASAWPRFLPQTSHFRSEPSFVVWKTWKGFVPNWTAPPAGLGGWTLSEHHALAPQTAAIEMGDGTRRSASAQPSMLERFAGVGFYGGTGAGEGAPAKQFQLGIVYSVAAGPDGSVYVGGYAVRRIDPDGVATTIAGAGNSLADGIPASEAKITGEVQGLAVGPDGAVYYTDWHVVRKISPQGIVTTVAGTGVGGGAGDGGPATAAQLSNPMGLAVAVDGSLLIADSGTWRIRRVDPAGIISTVAGGGAVWAGIYDGQAATKAEIPGPWYIAAAPDGSFYFATPDWRIWRVLPGGVIRAVAGDGSGAPIAPDGSPAVSSPIGNVSGLTVGPTGVVYFLTSAGSSIGLVAMFDQQGVLRTIAGASPGLRGDTVPALQGRIEMHRGIATGPDGSIYLGEVNTYLVRRIRPAIPASAAGDYLVASEDARQVFAFDAGGRHLRTLDAVTGALRYRFLYGATGRLVTIEDGDGNVTTLERDGAGRLTAIVAPDGQRTTTTVDGAGLLTEITSPAGERTSFTYDGGGLLRSLTDQRQGLHLFDYDGGGRLTFDSSAGGDAKTLVRAEQGADSYGVGVRTALGRTSTHLVESLASGDRRRTDVDPAGNQRISLLGRNGVQADTSSDGTVVTVTQTSDPRFGLDAPLSSAQVSTPAGLTRTVAQGRAVTLATPGNPLSVESLTESITVNGRAFTSTYVASTRTHTSTTPAGRSSTAVLDPHGRVATVNPPGVPPISLAYDPRGRLHQVTQGSRVYTIDYDAGGYPWRLTDPLSRQVTFDHDLAGRPWRQTLPGGRSVTFGHDAAGNLTSLTPPGRPAHGFGYDPADRMTSYTPPLAAGTGTLSTTYGYDLDGALTGAYLPDSTTVVPGYDFAGRVETVTTARGVSTIGYDGAGRVATLSTPERQGLTLGYDGFLPLSETSTGAVAGTVSRTFDNDFRVATASVNGTSVSYGYDADGLLTQAGALKLTRAPATGRIASTTLGAVGTTLGYSTYGELETVTAGTALYAYTLHRDLSGRIEGKTETVQGVTHDFTYGYDAAGRLEVVRRDGVLQETYWYDENGNRLTRTTAGGTETSTYDDQDRLLAAGSTSYTYGPAGDLRTRTTGAGTTTYSYDQAGNLLAAWLPDGRSVEYLTDALHRRVGKNVDGALVEGFLYDGQLRPVAWLNGAGQVYARFVYGTRVNVPEYMVTAAGTYRILTDHLGSPRLLVDAATGAVVQRMDHDAWGNVLADSNPGAQPFGFAGGLADRDTGLVRFGARDYEPRTGRWTNKDPIRFVGGLNLYAYADNDPVNWKDPTGLLVEAQYDAGSGLLQVIDLDTGRVAIINADSGGRPFGDPIPNGAYEILEQGRRYDFFRLDALDSRPRNDIHDPTGRDHFRLHRPGLTTGCIAARNKSGWDQVKDLIENTSTETVMDQASVPWYTPSYWSNSPRPLIKYGTLIVVGSR